MTSPWEAGSEVIVLLGSYAESLKMHQPECCCL
jgi:hypothetical protein